MTTLTPINPADLGAPRGYSHGMLAPAGGRLLAIAGQVAWDKDENVVGDDFPTQFAQALSNVVAVVREAGGQPSDLAQLTIFVVDHKEYVATLKAVGAAYRRIVGHHYPAMALVEVKALLETGAKIEIQGLAVVRPPGGIEGGDQQPPEDSDGD